MDIVTFVLGIVVLFKGTFRIAGRTIPPPKAKRIALLLMTPLALEFCYAPFLLTNTMSVDENGIASISMTAFDAAINQLIVVQIFVLALIGAAIVYIIYSVPPSAQGQAPVERAAPPPRFSNQPPPAVKPPPNIMDLKEAAAYMRMSEADVVALIEQGKLGAVRSGGGYKIARIAIEDFLSDER